jgi:hypothetical protein
VGRLGAVLRKYPSNLHETPRFACIATPSRVGWSLILQSRDAAESATEPKNAEVLAAIESLRKDMTAANDSLRKDLMMEIAALMVTLMGLMFAALTWVGA